MSMNQYVAGLVHNTHITLILPNPRDVGRRTYQDHIIFYHYLSLEIFGLRVDHGLFRA